MSLRSLFAAASLCAEAALYCAAPFAARLPMPPGLAAMLFVTFIPLALFPAACFAFGFTTGAFAGFSPAQALLAGALFVPAALMHYGGPAWAYAFAYSALSTAGLLLGGSLYLRRAKGPAK